MGDLDAQRKAIHPLSNTQIVVLLSFLVSLNPRSSLLAHHLSPITSHLSPRVPQPAFPTLTPTPVPSHRPSSPRTPHLCTPHPAPLTPHPSPLTPHPSPLTFSPLTLNPRTSTLTPRFAPGTSPPSNLSPPAPPHFTPHCCIPYPTPCTPQPSLLADSHQARKISLSQPPNLEPHASPLNSSRNMAGWGSAPASAARPSRSVQPCLLFFITLEPRVE